MNKIREVLSDEKQDWEHRVAAVSDFLPFPAFVDKCPHDLLPQTISNFLKNVFKIFLSHIHDAR